jgi:hypothetical protein
MTVNYVFIFLIMLVAFFVTHSPKSLKIGRKMFFSLTRPNYSIYLKTTWDSNAQFVLRGLLGLSSYATRI